MCFSLKYFKSSFIEFEITDNSVKNYQEKDSIGAKFILAKTIDGKKVLIEHFSLSNPENYNLNNLTEQANIIISCYPYYCSKYYPTVANKILFPSHRMRIGTKVQGNKLIVCTLNEANLRNYLENNQDEKSSFEEWANILRNELIDKGFKPIF